jgi:nucleoside-diphosphate-sugar epimerase
MVTRTAGAVTGPVAVTGAAGLIGHAVHAQLVAAGRSPRGHAGPAHLDGVETAPGEGYDWGDLTDEAWLVDRLAGAEAVVHLAGPSSVAASFADPAGAVAAHAGGTAAVVRAAARTGSVRRVVVASSAEVYGIPRTDRVAEDHALDPLSPYAAGKLGAEAAARAMALAFGLELVVLRPFAVYGERSPAWSLVGSCVRRALAGGPLTMTSLDRVRDLVHVDDVAAAFVAAATVALRDDEPIVTGNVCTGVGTRVDELARTVLAAAGSAGPIEQTEPQAVTEEDVLAGRRPPSSDPMRLVGDPSRACEVLGWRPRVTVADGVARVVAHVRTQAD